MRTEAAVSLFPNIPHHGFIPCGENPPMTLWILEQLSGCQSLTGHDCNQCRAWIKQIKCEALKDHFFCCEWLHQWIHHVESVRLCIMLTVMWGAMARPWNFPLFPHPPCPSACLRTDWLCPCLLIHFCCPKPKIQGVKVPLIQDPSIMGLCTYYISYQVGWSLAAT